MEYRHLGVCVHNWHIVHASWFVKKKVGQDSALKTTHENFFSCHFNS